MNVTAYHSPCYSTGDAPTEWSDVAAFDTAPSSDAWEARGAVWIGGFNELRADLVLPASDPVVRARAYVTGLGAFYLYVNGAVIGDHVSDPGHRVCRTRHLPSH